ncbi:amino acid/amide ABC transporter membrane protein 1, HAAT family [Roseovarius nanhaiticus]|uniref:Amino acid/amide ABC transporter membrane protein 1, HAAT family n=1 Tax=Roseovarius nanhaiticus TaxID=573024 RepID=A0A1N7HIE3_9RHOB|nr:branched-chain amino acid ABC transporter permease [Roseovarius nanhaiticus]SEK92022.1 amino acid/amide ABC transporter membrane protein 1, HAAT family [Roseovarius nanhaiticus]SIS24664.1 amino acid/amide ABC transporter membrane protein 1, HAAT family [Roseovarius nanhaiticus]
MLDFIAFAQNLSNGLLIGGVYALVGVGLTLIFGVMRTINFAHGDFVVLGMYSAVLFNLVLGWDPYLSLVIAMPVGFLTGVLIERLMLARLVEAPAEASMLATLGLSLVIGNTLLLTFGGEPQSVQVSYAASTIAVGPVRISVVLLLAGLATALAIIGLYLVLERTEIGRAIRGTSENRLGAELVGINTTRIHSIVFGLSVMLAMIAGATLIPLLFATPTTTGAIFTLKAFVVTVLGGLGRIGAAIGGGLLLGVVEVLGASYLASEYRDAYGLIAFLLILLLRPEGLFGSSVKRV